MLSAMRYKSFTWPHNPRTYEIRFLRHTAVHKVPMGLYTMQDLGRTCREMRGEGEFYGPDAYRTFQELACLFYEPGPGLLIHPVWQTADAYFTELALLQEPREDYVRYEFAFQEGYSGYGGLTPLRDSAQSPSGSQSTAASAAAAQYVTVVAGDTMWAIAQRAGLSLAELAALNPQIGNLNRIYAGQKVRVK